MKRSLLVIMLLTLVALAATAGNAGAVGTPAKISNQYLTDSDGDGIPNCQDPDYTPPLDGTGLQHRKPTAANVSSAFAYRYDWNWGLSFLFGGRLPSIGVAAMSLWGPGDGTGNGGVGPADGTGNGPGPFGTGDCDGSGSLLP
jgi:hypothetical protein